ncbi:cation-translocating P-type ATPase [Lachnospiraceae bacterium YH-ros2226]
MEETIQGLTSREAAEEIRKGNQNIQSDKTQKTVGDIIRENVLTYFNLIFLILTILLIVSGNFRGLTFLPVIIANTLIGIAQEIYAKSVLDKLSIMNTMAAHVMRDGEVREIPIDKLVLHDLVLLQSGDQIPADARVEKGTVSVNEALLTGEADEIEKKPGMNLMSGSFVVSGRCFARLTKVGENSYLSRLTREAREMSNGEQSEMVRSIDRLVRVMGVLLIPIGLMLFIQGMFWRGSSFQASVSSMVAVVLGMIPEGLYLLVSVTLAMSAARLALQKVMLHDMKSIESLARVDVLCVDKTGTITDTKMLVADCVLPGEEADILKPDADGNPGKPRSVEEKLNSELVLRFGSYLSAQTDDNISMQAIRSYFPSNRNFPAKEVLPFSSRNKYSGVAFSDGVYLFGAPEIILGKNFEKYRQQVDSYAEKGYRVMVFARLVGEGKDQLPKKGMGLSEAEALFFTLLQNPVRENAPRTFRFFRKQGVSIRVISGDNPVTVSNVARQAGIENADRYVDASTLKTREEIRRAVQTMTVFGRVTPEQKRTIVQELKAQGHTVAMTGDGVNDILAMKDSDCSIAMASGSDAAVQSAQVALLDSEFSHLPEIVGEGRRIINNIERSATLFLVKNIFSVLLGLFSIFSIIQYPLEPNQISLISAFNIGIPAFFLAMEPNRQRIKEHFMRRVLIRALPAALTDFLAIAAMVVFADTFGVSGRDVSVAATFLLAIVGFIILLNISAPWNAYRIAVITGCIAGLLFTGIFFNDLFGISFVSTKCAMLFVLFAIATEPCMRYLTRFADWVNRKVDERTGRKRRGRFVKSKGKNRSRENKRRKNL